MKSARIALAILPALFFLSSVHAQENPGDVFKVGGDVSSPQVLSRVDPEYTEQARKGECQGKVVLNVVVQRDGTVRDLRVVQSLDRGLDQKAIEAVRQWQFEPGMKNGQPVDVAAIIEVAFRVMKQSWWNGKYSTVEPTPEKQSNCDPQPIGQAPAIPVAVPELPNESAIDLKPPTLASAPTRKTEEVVGPAQILANIYLESLALLLTKITEDQQAVFWNSLNQQTLKALREEEDEKRREAILQAHRDLENSLRQHQAKLK